jgi:hypothetical protein
MSDREQRGLTPEGNDWDPDLGSLLGGIAVGMVLLGAIWLLVASLSGGHANGTAPDVTGPSAALGGVPATSQSAGSTGSASQASGPTRLERCTAAADAVEQPLQLARPALDQWDVHVGAMNKLVVGAITLQQATAFWNQTRVGAYHRIAGFEDAKAQLERQGVDCPAPRLLGSRASPALRTCAQHVAAELRALGSARTAIATWRDHMRAMDQLRAGKLSPTAATQMWLSMWQTGVRELQGYRDAASAAEAGSCSGSTGLPQPSGSPPSPASSPTSSMSGMNMP